MRLPGTGSKNGPPPLKPTQPAKLDEKSGATALSCAIADGTGAAPVRPARMLPARTRPLQVSQDILLLHRLDRRRCAWPAGRAGRSGDLEIRLVRDRYAVVEHLLIILGADFFVGRRPLNPPVTMRRLPWRIEGVGIIHRDRHTERLVVDQLPALHDVQLLGMWRAVVVHVGLGSLSDGVR